MVLEVVVFVRVKIGRERERKEERLREIWERSVKMFSSNMSILM